MWDVGLYVQTTVKHRNVTKKAKLDDDWTNPFDQNENEFVSISKVP